MGTGGRRKKCFYEAEWIETVGRRIWGDWRRREGRGRGKLDMGGVGKGKIGVEGAVLLLFVRRNGLVWEGERGGAG
jgi:hypothetical protein